MEWYLKSAELYNDTAMFDIGNMYEKGLGVEKNIEVAIKLYLDAAEI